MSRRPGEDHHASSGAPSDRRQRGNARLLSGPCQVIYPGCHQGFTPLRPASSRYINPALPPRHPGKQPFDRSLRDLIIRQRGETELSRMICRATVACALLFIGLGHPLADTIHVRPTTGTLQAAIDAASPGDTIRIHAGTYSETIQITKPLNLVGDGAADVMIDGGCGSQTAVEVISLS